jgi:hypothetical protein
VITRSYASWTTLDGENVPVEHHVLGFELVPVQAVSVRLSAVSSDATARTA